MTDRYKIVSTSPTVFTDPIQGVINGALVVATLLPYNEVVQVRVPRLDAELVKKALEDLADQRDALANL